MVKNYFYSHLVESSQITLEIAGLELKSEERVELISLAHANIHSRVISEILNNLSNEEKKIFLNNLTKDNHSATWTHLNAKITDAEKKVKTIIKKTVNELINDVREIKTKA